MTGLRPEDFRITVDGKPRTITTADYVAHAAPAAVSPAAPATPEVQPLVSSNVATTAGPPPRTVLLVVDEANIRAGYGRQAIAAAERFLDLLGPRDRVGLALIPYGHANIDPTTNHGIVKAALAHVVGHLQPVQDSGLYSLGLVEAFAYMNNDKQTWADAIRRECDERPGSTREGRPRCIQQMTADARRMVIDARQRLVESLRSFQALLTALVQLPGPKTLVLVSEQLPVAPYLPERSDFISESRRISEAAARARASVYVLHLHTPDFDVSTGLIPPTSSADADIRATGLEDVTSLTGGTRLMISGRPEVAFNRIALEISGYYLLGFRAEAADQDGKPHNIAVEVSRPGVEVRARKMFAVGDDAKAAPVASATDAVNQLLRAQAAANEIPMAVSAYALPDAGDGPPKVRVLISAEIDRDAQGEKPLTVGYAIFDGTGRNAGISVEQATLRPARQHPDSPLCYLAAAIVPPGDYTLRLAAADADLRRGAVEHAFTARPTENGALRIGDLVVVDPFSSEPERPRPTVSAGLTDTLLASVEIVSGPAGLPAGMRARLEVSATPTGPALVSEEMTLQPTTTTNRYQAVGSVSLSAIPPGAYVGRAVLSLEGQPDVQVPRPLRVVERAVAAVRPGEPQEARALMPPPAAPQATAAPPTTPPAVPTAVPAGTGPAAPSGPAKTVEEAIERAGRYVADYAEQLSLVIGIEHYTQWMQNADALRPVAQRQVSEFALVRVKDDWVGFRDVFEVDGKPVGDRKDRIERLFLQPQQGAFEQARRISDESSQSQPRPAPAKLQRADHGAVLPPVGQPAAVLVQEGGRGQDGRRGGVEGRVQGNPEADHHQNVGWRRIDR